MQNKEQILNEVRQIIIQENLKKSDQSDLLIEVESFLEVQGNNSELQEVNFYLDAAKTALEIRRAEKKKWFLIFSGILALATGISVYLSIHFADPPKVIPSPGIEIISGEGIKPRVIPPPKPDPNDAYYDNLKKENLDKYYEYYPERRPKN